MADERLPEYPDVPTLKELGYASGKGLWSALYAPAQTPPDVLETIHKATVRRSIPCRCRGVQEADDQAGAECLDRRRQGVEQAEIAHWRKLTETVKVEKPE